jgi:hypothetical protein
MSRPFQPAAIRYARAYVAVDGDIRGAQRHQRAGHRLALVGREGRVVLVDDRGGAADGLGGARVEPPAGCGVELGLLLGADLADALGSIHRSPGRDIVGPLRNRADRGGPLALDLGEGFVVGQATRTGPCTYQEPRRETPFTVMSPTRYR